MGITGTTQTETPWRVGHSSGYKRPYFVYAVNGGYALTATGTHRRFGSQEAAQTVADELNNTEINRMAAQRRRGPRHGAYVGRSFEQAEIEDEILIGELGCSVKFWSDNGINETKHLHFHTAEQTRAIGNAAIAISNTQTFESYREHLNAELEEVRQISMGRLGSAGEALLAALENALALLGTDIEKGMK